ncbi:MAG: sugar transferase, partial [Bacteroidales bacterium]|nr:sugar transferase [Bacteroidales bacterium]
MNRRHIGMHNNKNTNLLIRWLVVLGDFVVLVLVLLVAMRFIPRYDLWDGEMERVFWIMCLFAMIVAEYFFATVIHERLVGANAILRRTVLLVGTWSLLSYLLLRIVSFDAHLGWQILAMGLTMLVVVIVKRFVERWGVKKLRRKGYNTQTITLIGNDSELWRLYRKLVSNPTSGYIIYSHYGGMEGLTADGSVDDFVAGIEHPEGLRLGDEVYLCVSQGQMDLIRQTSGLCNHMVKRFYYVPTADEKLNLRPVFIDDINVMTNYSSPLEEPLNNVVKRFCDILVSVVALMAVALLLPVIVVAIKVQSPGPVFFRQRRTGLDGREFYCYKFRSMHVNDDADRLQATEDDPRKFPFGDFMRKTNIDELPQFWN